jgi:FkbM family methyltransferase
MKDLTRLRRLLYPVVNRRLYQLAGGLLNSASVVRVGGLSAYRSLKQRTPPPGASYCSVKLGNVPHPIYFRPGTDDALTIVQNLARCEYGMFRHRIDAVNIIDAGAFIGDLSIFFHCRFPTARIIALEPNQENYRLAELNLRPYSDRVKLLNAGLWGTPTTLSVTGESTVSHLTAARSSDVHTVNCVDVDTIMADAEFTHIDILKLDIEGAEQQVFSTNYRHWLPVTKLVIVEFHGEEIERQGLDLLRDNGFESYRYRSLYYCYNSRFFPA